jgi:hypothetical protein
MALSLGVSAQSDNDITERSSIKDRIYLSPNVGGFVFSKDITAFALGLTGGYRFTQKLSAGVGTLYRYTNYRNFELKTNSFGYDIFARYNITDQYFVRVDYEILNLEIPESVSSTRRQTFNSFLVGGGYSSPIGNRAFLNIAVYYNLSHDNTELNRPYESALIPRIGVSFGL